jgi:hypothetical protein
VSIQKLFTQQRARGKTALGRSAARLQPLPTDRLATVEQVQKELIEMGSWKDWPCIPHRQHCPGGQVIYDHNRRSALDRVNRFLDGFGDPAGHIWVGPRDNP